MPLASSASVHHSASVILSLTNSHLSPTRMGIGKWPSGVKFWTNIAEKGDVVALEKKLAQRFGTGVKDVLVSNGSSAHSGERYLTTLEAGRAVAEGLW